MYYAYSTQVPTTPEQCETVIALRMTKLMAIVSMRLNKKAMKTK